MPVDKLTIEQFAQKVKAKYPQYKDIDDSVLVDKMTSKYPEYKDKIIAQSVPAALSQQAPPQQKAFQIKISAPTYGSTSIPTGTRTFTDQPSEDPHALTKLHKKATEAKANLDVEMSGNDAQYEKRLREFRRDHYTMEDLKKDAQLKGYRIPIGQENELLKIAKQKQYDSPITSEDISDIKTGTMLNVSGTRTFLKDLGNPKIQKDAYLVDAYNHAAQDEQGAKRATKIKDNAKKIEKGELIYDPVNMMLGKPEGFINSLFTGRNDLEKSFDFYSYLKDAPDAAIIDKLNHELTSDIDEPIPVPSGKLGEVGRLMGGQPLKGLIAGGVAAAAATVSGNPQAASGAFNLVNAGVSAIDMYKIGFANAVRANYASFKQQGLSDQEALNKAKILAEDQANTDAASAALMSFAAGKMAFKPTGLSTGILKKSLGAALTQLGEVGAKKSLEGLGIGAMGGIGQIIKNIQAQNAGLPIETSEGFKEQVEAGVLLTAATHVIAKASSVVKPSTIEKLATAVAKYNPEAIANRLNAQQEDGHITSEEAQQAQQRIEKARTIDNLIPDDIPETDRLKIGAKIRERNILKDQLEKVDEAYHPEIKEKVKALNEEIIGLSKGIERGELQKLVTKEINAGKVHGTAKEPLRHASEEELSAYMKDIAEQSHDPVTEQATIDAFGQKIVNKAKEMYPKSKYKGYIDEPDNDGSEQVGMVQDKKMREKATGFIGEIKREKSSSYGSAEEIGKKVGANIEWDKESGTLSAANENSKTILLARNYEYKGKPLNEATKAKIKNAYENGAEFILGDMTDVDTQLIDYLNEIGAPFTIYRTKGNEPISGFTDSEKFKITENATPIRSDERQIPLGRPESTSGQEQSGSNIQRQEGAEPIPAQTEQQAGNIEQQQSEISGEKMTGMEGGIPPPMHDLPFIPGIEDVTRLAHADTEQIYKELNMSDRIPRATKEDVSLEREADDLIKNGYDFEGKADRVLSGRDKSFTDAEQVAFAKMVGALNVKLQGLEVNTPEFNSTLDTIERLSRASDKVGSEEGAAFRARRMFVLNDETLSAFMQKAKEANLDIPLTEEQAANIKARFDDLKASRDAYRARLEKVAAENAVLKAEQNIKKITSAKSAKTKKTHDDYVKERKDIIEQMREKLRKSRGEANVAFVPYAKELIAIAPEVGKLVKNLIEEGVDRLDDIVKNVHSQINDLIPDITEKDIHDIIAGEYSKKQTKTDIQEKIYDLRTQAQLINRLEALRAGIQPKERNRRTRRNAEIEELRKQIRDLTERPEKSEAEKLAALKARYRKQIEELQKKIDAGDFEPNEKSTIALDKEAQDLKDAYIKKKIEWQKFVAEEAYKNRTPAQKAGDKITEVLNIPRTVMASADLSAPLRQGLVVTTSHPVVASKAFIESLKQAVSPQRFDRWLYNLKESDYYKQVLEPFGLYIADPNNLHLSAKEEAYMTNLAEKIPILGKHVIARSERAYVAYLNKMRVDIFTMYAKGFSEKGMTPETRPDLYEGLAAFVNAATGRGELGDLERSSQILNTAFFSPRLIASRINLLNPVWYASLPKEVRVTAIKDMAKMIGIGATTIGLLSLVPGIKVEKDPRSPDFGKIHIGNTRWDIWGGFQQYIRLASQLLSGYEKKSNGNVVPLGTERNQHTRADKMLSFFRGKLAPVPSIAADLLTGKTATGEDVELTKEMKEHLIPMIGNDVADAWKEQGPISILTVGVPSFLGVGTSTYEPKIGESKGKSTKNTKSSKTSKEHK